jgi:hypothetical protein
MREMVRVKPVGLFSTIHQFIFDSAERFEVASAW